MKGTDNARFRVLGLIVRHDAWCALARGEGGACVCNPTSELVDGDTLAETVARDLKNRAQRRAMAKASRRAAS